MVRGLSHAHNSKYTARSGVYSADMAWTTQQIEDTLINDELISRFRRQLGDTAEDGKPALLERWTEAAQDVQKAVARATELAAAEDAGLPLPGADQMVDRTDWIRAEAARIEAERGKRQ